MVCMGEGAQSACAGIGRSHKNSGGLRLNERRWYMRNIATPFFLLRQIFKHVAVLLRRHTIGIYFEDGILLVRKSGILFLVPTRRPPIIGLVCEHHGVEANPLDSAARLRGHWGWEVDLWAFHFFL